MADNSALPADRPRKLYPLGPLEETFRFISQRFNGDGNAALIVRLAGRLEPEPLAGALAALQRRHPRLRARIVPDAEGRHCYEILDRVPPIPLEIKDFPDDELPWEAEGLAVVAERFDLSAGPFLRVKVLRSATGRASELIINFHHAIVDGVSGSRVIHEVMANYEALAGGTSLGALQASQALLPLVPEPIPQLTAPLWDRAEMFLRMVRGYIRKRRRKWTPLPNDSAAYNPRFERASLSKEDSGLLVRRCRAMKVPTYGAMFAAALSSMAQCLGEGTWRLAARCPIDARGLPGAPEELSDEHLGCFVTGLDRVYKVRPPVPFWEIAHQACEDCRRFIRKQGPAMAIRLLPLANRGAKVFNITTARPPMRDSLSVDYMPCSGLRQQYAGMAVEAFSGVNRNRFLGVSAIVGGFSLKNQMSFTIGTVDVSEAFRRDFQQAFFEMLQKVIHQRV